VRKNLIEARALLSPSFMQTEIQPPGSAQPLEGFWRNSPAAFSGFAAAVVASEGGEQHWVLVTTQFSNSKPTPVRDP